MTAELPKAFVEQVRAVTARRPRAVIDHILKHGSVTTEQIREMGYNHPPRAVRDVRELGIPVETTRIRGTDGRSIARYTFGDPGELVAGLQGRTAVSRRFKTQLIGVVGPRCAVCGLTFTDRYLQVDHRVPVEVGGDEPDEERVPDDYMLLDAGCNRAKSWSCEHCLNFVDRNPDTCRTCYWAVPDGEYEHVAMVPERRLALVWQADEVQHYVALASAAEEAGVPLTDYVKRRLRSRSE